ncbi:MULTISPECIES: DUF6527 family protein [Rhizobium]|uniref:Uncharacterized protein n=1 Tax=Rhizobium phaseoli TaxID=396 RepID=A0A192TI38_9HYPH|nr:MULTISPECIES: DUF6527 family protein [Rhizobium]ANL43369.1 hypothetical protein AMC88_PB00293 [Rhizobium phaseoli]ANL56369.1 hypothetical protein AMC86_PC00294 [Rhizobium phaseoli]ANL62355.1 hypothetical protein AMC85_PB00293 [Rhizobium phaseoli]ANL87769.1 hypothetical protein AMC81_PC00294 [Rhizobium phaseoli]ANL94278.1 hypothetical protein AMC80_PC00294 [Rhizobium phaseoli]
MMRVVACKILVALRLVPRPAFTARFTAEHPDPDAMADSRVYIVGGRGYSKWAYFRCPADREEIVQLSLMSERYPRWTVAVDWLGRPTIDPSVRQLDGTYAHFWIRKGVVGWCGDSGRKPEVT